LLITKHITKESPSVRCQQKTIRSRCIASPAPNRMTGAPVALRRIQDGSNNAWIDLP